ncbi:DNA-binding response regulator [Mucilaginibacter conchicola]|uniref:DNA-binding response regulator n=1 Tax=Mucilaginibacter conchicola TaxID=2303333 RepID=A0A372NMX9_9SPHI|nr:response regulator transcription factor [Mucilaginibacter conchicola]RFZ90301.1 DNA-binding response regulator [Mucilaginibacter conchicola]
MKSEINIAVVDDQNLFRQSLAILINSINDFKLVTECSGGQEFIDALQNGCEIDVAIIDLDMPGINGIELNKYLQANYPAIKVIILTGHANEMLITQMINNGAASYLMKNCDKNELITTIEAVVKNGFYFNNEVKMALKNSTNQRNILTKSISNVPIKITRREMQVLDLICKDRNNNEIADSLYLSVRTIEGHRTSLINKIGCHTTAGLVLFAIKYHLIDLGL